MIALILLVAILAGTAVYMGIRRSSSSESKAVPSDPGPSDPGSHPGSALGGQVTFDAAVVAPPAVDAAVAAMADASEPVAAMADASEPVAVDAGTPAASDAGTSAEEKAAQAKALLKEADDAIQEAAFEKALRAAEASIALKRQPKAYVTKAKALQRMNRIDEALAALASAEAMAPKYASVFEARGRILWALQRKEEARVQFELFLELEPTGPRATQIQKFLDEPR
jgi:tetratricopeptide (TPR) repeat protein